MRIGNPSTMAKKSPRTTAKQRRVGRRHPLATVALIAVGLLSTGGAYALATTTATADTSASQQQLIEEGERLFEANCATCHGLALQGTAEGPTLIGVGEASVHFQVGTGRMPLAASGPQAEQKPVQFTEDQVEALYTYVGSKSPGPGLPAEETISGEGDAALGGELFRINCAMCHNVAGAGGALTEGKWAPALNDVDSIHVYEAMVTGPQNMPVFNNNNLTLEDKADIITYLQFLEENPSPGGFDLGNLGPVSEGLFIWIFGLGAIVAITVWLTAKAS